MSLKKYKFIDLCAFIILAMLFEALNYVATVNVLGDYRLIFLSYTIVLCIISMYRIGIAGIFVGIFGSLAACFAAKSSELAQYVAYLAGGVSILIPWLFFQCLLGRKRLKNGFLIVLYLISCFIVVILTRVSVLALFNYSTFKETFITNLKLECVLESMSLVISIIILLIANRKNSHLIEKSEDYVHYVKDLSKLGHLKEYQNASNFNSDRPFTEFGQIDNSNILDGGELSAKELKELDDLYNSHLENEEKEEKDKKE